MYAEIANRQLHVSENHHELRKNQSKTAVEFVLNLRTLKDGVRSKDWILCVHICR